MIWITLWAFFRTAIGQMPHPRNAWDQGTEGTWEQKRCAKFPRLELALASFSPRQSGTQIPSLS